MRMYEMIKARVDELKKSTDLNGIADVIASEFSMSVDGAKQAIITVALADVLLGKFLLSNN